MFIGITKQIHMISNSEYLNKTIETETVITIQIFFLMSQNNLVLAGLYLT